MGLNAPERKELDELKAKVDSLATGVGVALAALRDIRGLVVELKRRQPEEMPRIIGPGGRIP